MTKVDQLLDGLDAWYRSDENDLAEEFYVPCLSVADRYDRAVGYFTSGSLPILAQGLDHFLQHEGRMRIVCSPMLSERDSEAIREGYEARDDVVGRALVREIDEAADRFARATELLAWMIAEEVLDIQVALPLADDGIYHEKFGIFSLDGEDLVAFMGSPNETLGGILVNFEQIAVFTSKSGDREASRVDDFREQFERLWSNETEKLEVIPFPNAAKRALIQHRPSSKPRPASGGSDFKASLYPHQVAAVKAWGDADHRGIFEMATGTGKTITALAGTRPMARQGNLVIILVPGVDLLSQWEAVIKERIPGAAVLTCGGDQSWKNRISDFLQRWRIQSRNRRIEADHDSHYLIATMDTAISDRFMHVVGRVGQDSVLIVDEVHRIGAPSRRRALELPSRYRLGLSATPDRPWDMAGQQAIEDGVGTVCFSYTLTDAIDGGYLTPYEYKTQLVPLTGTERARYSELSTEITEKFNILASKYPEAGRDLAKLLQIASDEDAWPLQSLLFQRADVLKEAQGKLGLVRRLGEDKSISSCLMYCNDEGQVTQVARELRDCHRTHAFFTTARLEGEHRKTVLRDFEQGRFDFLVSIRCLDEGIDIPGAEHAAILASSKTEREFIQRRGRVLRRAPGKDRSVIHDPIVVPVPLDEDGYPLESITDAEESILVGELRRCELFAAAAENKIEALEALEAVRRLIRLAESERRDASEGHTGPT